MKPKLLRACLPGLPLIVLTSATVRADNDGSWLSTATTGSWADTTKWTGGFPAYGSVNTATFGTNITATTTITQDVPGLLIGNLAFSDNGGNSSAWTLSGTNAITLGNGTTPGQFSTVTTTTPATIGTVLNGLNMLVKEGAATLTLTKASTWSGGTTINTGYLSLGTGGTGADTSSATALGSGPVTINTGSTLRLWIQNNNSYTIANNWVLNGGTLLVEDGIYALPGTMALNASGGIIASKWDGKSITSSGVISGGGPLSIALSPGSNSTGDVILAGENTYTGATSITGSRLTVSSLNSVAGGTASSNLGAPVTVADGTLSIGSTTTGTLVYKGSGEVTDRVVNLSGLAGGAILTQSGTGLLKFSSGLTATGVGSKTLGLAGSTAGTGEIAGAIVDNGTTGTTALAATFAANATTVTLSSVEGVAVGATISGTGITGGQTITAINTGTRVVTLSSGANAASGAVGSTYTITGVKNITSVAKSGSGTWTLSGANAYTGATTVTGGVLKFARQTVLYNGTPASWTAANLTVNSGCTAAFHVGGSGEFTAADITTLQGLTNVVSGTSATLGFRSGSILGLDTTNAAGANFVPSAIIADHVAGTTTDTLGLRKLGSGTLTLGSINTYTGGTTIDGGTINLTTGGGTGAIRGNLTVASGATLKVSAVNGMGNTAGGRIGGTTLNGTVDIQNTGLNSFTTMTFTTTGGTITGMAGSKLDLRNNGAGDVVMNTLASAATSVISVSTLGLAGGSPVFNTATGTTASGIDLLVTSNIINDAGTGGNGSGTHNLIKNGAGHMRISGTNTYTGSTTVNAGTLSGTGCATSALSVAAAGTLAPGAGIGTWAATAATFVSGSTFKAEINSTATTADKLAATGAVDLGGATLNLTDLGAATLATGTKLTLVDYTGGSLTGTFAGLVEGAAVTSGANTFAIHYADGSKVTLTAGGGYSAWAATNAGGQAANLDSDGDGVPNGVEYLMGVTGSSFTANPKPVNGVVTWPKDPAATATYVVQVSADLATWTTATSGVTDNGSSVSYTLPPGDPKRFTRLKVTLP